MIHLETEPFPVLQTERLRLRSVVADDVHELFKIRSDPEMMRYIPRPIAKTTNDAMVLINTMLNGLEKKESINWVLTEYGSDKFIGTLGYVRMQKDHDRAEIGYMLQPEFHGKSYMHEALQPVLTFGFKNMGLHTIEAIIEPGNIASEKLLQKNGFVKEAHFRENYFFDGRFIDSVHYTKFHNS